MSKLVLIRQEKETHFDGYGHCTCSICLDECGACDGPLGNLAYEVGGNLFCRKCGE